MSKTVVVYHSSYGHTERVAKAVAEGADAQLIAIDATGEVSDDAWAALNAADAIIFGSPTYMGNVSWQFKKFAEATSKIWATRGWQDKLFGGFANSASLNGDKHNVINSLQVLAFQHGGIWVSLGLMPTGNTKGASRDDLNSLGAYGGALTQSPADADASAILEGDLKTAKLYGKRVSDIAAKLAR